MWERRTRAGRERGVHSNIFRDLGNRLKTGNYRIGCSGRADNAWCCRISNERCSGLADIVG